MPKNGNNTRKKANKHTALSTICQLQLTNSCLLKGENQPECQACQSALTVTHILIDCTHLSAVRQRHFRVDTLKELFETVDSRNIIAFIKDINFYHYI